MGPRYQQFVRSWSVRIFTKKIVDPSDPARLEDRSDPRVQLDRFLLGPHEDLAVLRVPWNPFLLGVLSHPWGLVLRWVRPVLEVLEDPFRPCHLVDRAGLEDLAAA